jgi:hypothetical protein
MLLERFHFSASNTNIWLDPPGRNYCRFNSFDLQWLVWVLSEALGQPVFEPLERGQRWVLI